MKILHRYILKGFTFYFLGCFISLLSIGALFAVLSGMELLKEAGGSQIFWDNILSSLPLLAELVAPISVLLATILTFSSLSKTSEAVAMTAAGLSTFDLVKPILMAGVLISGMLYFNQSYLATWWKADQKISLLPKEKVNRVWRFYNGNLLFFAGIDELRQGIGFGESFKLGQNSRIQEIERMQNIQLFEQESKYVQIYVLGFEEGSPREILKNSVEIKGRDFPVIFKPHIQHPKYTTFTNLWDEIEIRKTGGEFYTKELFALYQKFAAMLGVFVMILLALPFSIFSGRAQNVRVGVVASIALGFVFWLGDQIFASMFEAGLLQPWLAAFLANMIFATLAFYLILTKKT